jgi:hypothetical protein
MTSKHVQRNAQGQEINELGVTFNQWAENLRTQYRLNLKKLRKIRG